MNDMTVYNDQQDVLPDICSEGKLSWLAKSRTAHKIAFQKRSGYTYGSVSNKVQQSIRIRIKFFYFYSYVRHVIYKMRILPV